MWNSELETSHITSIHYFKLIWTYIRVRYQHLLSSLVKSPLETTPLCSLDSYCHIIIAYSVCAVYESDSALSICCFVFFVILSEHFYTLYETSLSGANIPAPQCPDISLLIKSCSMEVCWSYCVFLFSVQRKISHAIVIAQIAVVRASQMKSVS